MLNKILGFEFCKDIYLNIYLTKITNSCTCYMLLVTCIIFILTRSQAHQGWYGILEEVDILADVVQTGWLRLMVQVALEELDDGFP